MLFEVAQKSRAHIGLLTKRLTLYEPDLDRMQGYFRELDRVISCNDSQPILAK